LLPFVLFMTSKYATLRHQLMLFGICNAFDEQQCELHEMCGKTICISEVTYTKQEPQHDDGKDVLRTYQIPNIE
jgi:hypothetical protein